MPLKCTNGYKVQKTCLHIFTYLYMRIYLVNKQHKRKVVISRSFKGWNTIKKLLQKVCSKTVINAYILTISLNHRTLMCWEWIHVPTQHFLKILLSHSIQSIKLTNYNHFPQWSFIDEQILIIRTGHREKKNQKTHSYEL